MLLTKLHALLLLSILVCVTLSAFAQNDDGPLKFRNRIVFSDPTGGNAKPYFLDDDKKLLLIGGNSMEVWDVENSVRLYSLLDNPPLFSEKAFDDYERMDSPRNYIIDLGPVPDWPFDKGRVAYIEPDGKWIASVEETTDAAPASVIVRDLETGKQLAKLDLPGVSAGAMLFDKDRNELVTFGQTDKTAAFAYWDPNTFVLKRLIKIERYKWHQLFRNDEKMIVGTGEARIVWAAGNIKEGDTLTLRDVKTGAIEKEFTANDVKPESSFRHTTISKDEKYLVAERDDHVYVWDIDGNGQPKFEISSSGPNGKLKSENVIGGRLIVVSRDKDLLFYDIAGDGKPKFELSSLLPKNKLSVDAVSNDGEYFAVGEDEKIALYKTDGDGKPVFEKARKSKKEKVFASFMDEEKFFVVRCTLGYTHKWKDKGGNTIFYDIEKSKIAFEVPKTVNGQMQFVQQKRYLYAEGLGETTIWNIADGKLSVIPLQTRSGYCSSDDPGPCDDSPYNVEHTTLSPDGKFVLKSGWDDVSLFDIETGKQVQTIFDPDRVKYDKHNKIKYSGLDQIGWTNDGRLVYARSTNYRDVLFWTVRK